MRKIMLVMDDYKELVATENLLRRLGFDVLSLGKDVLVADALVRFHPDVVIASAKGRAVDGIKVSQRVKKLSPQPRVALAYLVNHAPTITAETKPLVDALVVMPIQAAMVIKVVAQMAKMEPGPLLEKYQKMTNQRGVESLTVVSDPTNSGAPPVDGSHVVRGADSQAVPESRRFVEGGGATENGHKEDMKWDPAHQRGKSAVLRSSRSDGYDTFLRARDEKPTQVISRDKLASATKQLRKDSEAEKDVQSRIDEERKAFAKAMFELKKESGG